LAAKNTATASLHAPARQFADKERPLPGSDKFNQLATQIAQTPIPRGALFLDKTNLYHAEFMYRFDRFHWADVLVGGSYRMYQLNSDGTLFAKNPETGEEYKIHELGAYMQAVKTMWNNRLKATFGMRYDRNLSFRGQATPRLGLVFSPYRNSNIRVSYQTGFRLPTTQNQYTDLPVPGQHNLGGVREVIDRYDLNGKAITQVSYNTPDPQFYTYGDFGPETVRTWEIGYKNFLWNVVSFDVVYYRSTYPNKTGSINVIKIKPDQTTELFNIVQNYPDNTYQHGLAASIEYALPAKFNLRANYSRDVVNAHLLKAETSPVVSANGTILDEIPPRSRWNISLGNSNLFKTGISFNVSVRHQAPALNFTSIVPKNARATSNQPFLPAQTIVDAQLSKKIHSLKSLLKIGTNNLLGTTYRTTIGNPYIGRLLYVSLIFDELLN
jgi:iron complex outermembrane recepter protein